MPDQCVTVEAGINQRTLRNTTGITHPTEPYSGKNHIVIAGSLSTASISKFEVRVTNTLPNRFTLKRNATVAEFTMLYPQESKQLQPLNR